MKVYVFRRTIARTPKFFVAFLDGNVKLDEIGPFNTRAQAEIESCYHEKELQDA